MNNPCPICEGSGKAKQIKGPCVCGGTGNIVDAYRKLEELFIRERNEHQEAQEALRSLQHAVLGFIFDPNFKRMDRNGFFKRYWQDKLQCKIVVTDDARQRPHALVPLITSSSG